MADLRTFINPFTKNEVRMRRNTRDSRWVSADDGPLDVRKQAGPSKTYNLVTQNSSHFSQIPVISVEADDRESRLSDIQEISPKTSNRFRSNDQTRQTSPISPIFPSYAARRDSPVSAIEPNDPSPFREERNESNATVFPNYPTIIKKPEPRPKRSLVGLFCSAKLIYAVGPEGEGQKIWKGYRQFQKEKQKHTVDGYDRPVASSDNKKRAMPRSKVLGLTAHPVNAPLAVAPSLRPLPAQSKYRSEFKNNESSESSRPHTSSLPSEGKISLSSRDVPIGIDNSIRQFVDVNKPLPPAPRLQPPPKTKREVTGSNEHMVGMAAAGIQFLTQWQGKVSNTDDDDSHLTTWWTTRAHKRTEKAHQTLKAKISRPGLIEALSEGRTVNVAPECGGVGGPAAAKSAPVGPVRTHHIKRKEVRPPPPLNLDFLKERTKGKQKVKESAPTGHWRDMFDTIAHPAKGARRRSSESSFECQGLPDDMETAFMQGAGPLTHFQTHKTHVDGEATVPELLFSRNKASAHDLMPS